MAKAKQPHYIVVSGGVISGSGKGITAASLGALFKARGAKVSIQKFDMYLNVDAGTLKPGKHGEVFVTTDGAETDLDLGHYERFLDIQLDHTSSVMQGRVLLDIITKERSGGFRGDDVQVIPHVTGHIQDLMVKAAQNSDIHIIELGGTVGDYEGLSTLEAARQLAHRVGRSNITYVHLVYLPYIETSNEIKTKPAQNSVRDLRSIGILPDVLLARCERAAPAYIKDKLSLFTDVTVANIGILPNAKSVYQVPLMLEKQGIAQVIAGRANIKTKPDLASWKDVVNRATKDYPKTIKIGMIAKYLDNLDTYFSVTEGLKAAAWSNKVNLILDWVDAESLEKMPNSERSLKLMSYDGILVPGGFGERGVEGMIWAAGHAADAKIPYFGICLGMQVATIAKARAIGLKDANSKEINPQSPHLVITTMEGQDGQEMTGGTMRLGSYPCKITQGTLAHKIYGDLEITERHRHRFEFNPTYKEQLEKGGLVISGICPENGLVEIVEIADHPFYIGVQYHPEFGSRPYRPQPIFDKFIAAVKKRA